MKKRTLRVAAHHRDKLAQTAYVTRESQAAILRDIIRGYAHGEYETTAKPVERNEVELELTVTEDYELARARAEREGVTIVDVVRTEIERRYSEAVTIS
jgi:hypothetical protein